ncbi:MAG: efflux transporter periplasmic adaptor subunit, partial [Rhodanobacter sp.]|nr:efflux transporter periplasmic adaptor subunit [Rhodanobacter sp.]
RKDISTGDMRGGDWVVTTGLQARDRIIVSGVQKAREGMSVKALPWPHDDNTTAKPSAGTAAVSGK